MIDLVSDSVMNPFAKAIQPLVKLGLIPGLVLFAAIFLVGVSQPWGPFQPQRAFRTVPWRFRRCFGRTWWVWRRRGMGRRALRSSRGRLMLREASAVNRSPGAGAKSTLSRGRWSFCWGFVYIILYMGMDQYLLIPFLGGWTSIYQLFWCSPGVQGFDTLPYNFIYRAIWSHVRNIFWHVLTRCFFVR